MIKIVENDLCDLIGVCKYFGVYLMGVCDVVVKFSDLYCRMGDVLVCMDFEILLDDFEVNFVVQIVKMFSDD